MSREFCWDDPDLLGVSRKFVQKKCVLVFCPYIQRKSTQKERGERRGEKCLASTTCERVAWFGLMGLFKRIRAGCSGVPLQKHSQKARVGIIRAVPTQGSGSFAFPGARMLFCDWGKVPWKFPRCYPASSHSLLDLSECGTPLGRCLWDDSIFACGMSCHSEWKARPRLNSCKKGRIALQMPSGVHEADPVISRDACKWYRTSLL